MGSCYSREEWMNEFKCKRLPDGLSKKLKVGFCVQGNCQKEGIDYFDTFARVVLWQTVCLMLVLSVILDLATKQVNYTATFVHVPNDEPPISIV
jgi:hypothetical protein